MLKRLSKRSGNRYTIMSIIMIILMMYVFKLTFAGKEGEYPQNIYYKDYKYQYSQTISESSLKFVREYGTSYEGNMLLLKRGENWKTAPSRVYIFTGWRKYREYELVQ